MSEKPISFAKYEEMGAYHWVQCDRSAPNYNPPLEARYKVVVDRVMRAKHLLDIGCGDGYLLSRVSPLSERAIGIDSELAGAALAQKKLSSFSNCQVMQANCYEIPLPDRSFDVVLLTDVFEHLDTPERCIGEVARLLTADGRLLLTTPKFRPDRMWDHLHFKEYNPNELVAFLEPYFEQIDLSFFWPMSWYNQYSTRVGHKVLRTLLRHFPNPYARVGFEADKFGQMLAVCSKPRGSCDSCQVHQ